MIEWHPLRLAHKPIFILQLNFLGGLTSRCPRLSDCIMETSKEWNEHRGVFVGQYSKIWNIIPSGRLDRTWHVCAICVSVHSLRGMMALQLRASTSYNPACCIMWAYSFLERCCSTTGNACHQIPGHFVVQPAVHRFAAIVLRAMNPDAFWTGWPVCSFYIICLRVFIFWKVWDLEKATSV